MNSLFLLIALLLPGSDHSPAGSAHVQRSAVNVQRLQERSDERELRVSASFIDRQSVETSEPIELLLSRPLKDSDERLRILIGNTDVSSLFSQVDLRLRYDAKLWPLPLGESTVTVYLVSNTDEWKELARFTLIVDNESTTRERSSLSAPNDFEAAFIKTSYFDRFASVLTPTLSFADESSNRQEPAESSPKPSGKKGKIKFVPTLTFGLSPRPAQSTFPAPETRAETPLANLTMDGGLTNDVTYGSFSSHSTAMFAGHSVQQETLRFGDLGNAAPKVDLADYLFQFQTGAVKYQVGNFSFGDLPHLINGFPSRGIAITVPLLKRFDFSAAAMNGSLPVGYGNFFGLSRRRHQLLSGTMGLEIFAKRPGGLRLEVGGLAASVKPITGVNTGAIVNQQRSRGFSLRLIANDKEARFHFDGGFTRSFSIHPSGDDTLLEEPGLTKNAQYLEVRYQVLKDFSLSKTRKANLTVTFTESNVAASFESVGAPADADKIRYRVLLDGSVDDITGSFFYDGNHDNLNKSLPLRSRIGLLALSMAAPAKALLGRTKDSPWLPGLSYGFARDHGFGIAIPINGVFELTLADLSNVVTTNHNFTARWQAKKLNLTYDLTHMLLDNQQIGRELADHTALANKGTLGVAVNSKLDLSLGLSAQSVANRGDGDIGRTYELTPGFTWKPTNQMTLTGNFSNTIAGNAVNRSHSRKTNFDASWSYSFKVGTQELKKLAGSFSVSYSNGYQHSLDRCVPFDNLSKNQALITSMSFTLF